jgi:hypothetical protein
MGAVAGANEAEQRVQGAEQPAPRPEPATTGQVPGPAAETVVAPTREQTVEQAAQPTREQTTKQAEQPTTEHAAEQTAEQAPGFGERGRMRRRARFLRKARELAYRDLGGLVFDLHRFGQRNDQLVLAKLATLGQIDRELRELEAVLRDRRPVTVLREVGIAACPRCAAIHGSDDRFCPGCGLAFDANADRPISTAPVPQMQPAPASTQASALASSSASASPPSPASKPAGPPAMAHPSATASAPMQAPTTVQPPPVKQRTAPVAARPAPPTRPEQKKPERAEEDEPTQILRPPATGA